MKIALIAPTYLPAFRANTIQVMKMGQAMAELGHNLRIFVPKRDTNHPLPTWAELSHHYGLEFRFEIEWLRIYPSLKSYDYGFLSVRQAQKWGADLIYTRLPQAAAIASLMGIPSVNEIHDLPQGKLAPWLLTSFIKGKGARALVVITEALRNALVERFNAIRGNRTGSLLPLLIIPDGVDLARYHKIPAPMIIRQSLNSSCTMDKSSFTAGYTGNLYPGRGINLILDIAKKLPDMQFLLVGGEAGDVARIQQKISTRGLENIFLTGFVPNAELPQYQAACDILLMPYQRRVAASSGGDIAKYLSPMKLFEYMACGRTIISSDLPVLREILNTENAILLPPDDLFAWVNAIRDIRSNPEKRARLTIQAQQDVQKYSWKTRAQKILSVIET